MRTDTTLGQAVKHAFSTKVYPNPKDPAVLALLKEGQRQLEDGYLGNVFPWYLNGTAIYGAGTFDTGAYFSTVDPNDPERVIGYFPNYNADLMDLPAQLGAIRDAGRKFFKTVPWQRRVELLEMISKVAQERFWLLCAAKAYEQGQSFAEQIGETDEEVDFPLANAWYLERLNLELVIASPSFAGEMNARRFVPHGVFLDVSPFNFPGAIPMDMMTKALAMGNAVIEKSSPKSALSGFLVFETVRIAFERMGIDWRGVINYAPGGADVVDAMLASPYVSGMSFTGSTAVLSAIKERHGGMLREGWAGKAPLVFGSAETSGVNPFVVCKGTDPRYAAQEYVKAVIGRQGQKCSSARVAIIHESLFAQFCGNVSLFMDALKYGDVKDGADIGAVATAFDRDKLVAQVGEATGSGGFAVTSYVKQGCDRGGHDFPPTILMARHDGAYAMADRIMNTEFFGPVSTVVSFNELTDVEFLLSHSKFALTGAFFTDDMDEFERLLEIMPAGNLYWNRKCTGALVDTECFGGLRSLSSPVGIKGQAALNLFGSQQTLSGKYPDGSDVATQESFIKRMLAQGYVFGKF